MVFDPFSDLLPGSNLSSAQPSPQVPRQQDITANSITTNTSTAEQDLISFFGSQTPVQVSLVS